DPEGASHKFYEVTVDGAAVTTRFGRIGTTGQTKVDSYGSPSEALSAAEKKINEKLHKGYEVTTKGEREKKPIPRRAKPSAEEQLQNLSDCGISLKPGMSKELLFTEYEPEDYVNEPYLLLLTALGGETEEESYGFLSSDIWHFDTECIEDHGDYARIALRMEELAGGDLPLEAVEDYVDVEEGRAWMSFSLDSQNYKWELKVEDDWVDTRVFGEFDALLRGRHLNKRFTYLNLGGQDCLIGCSTPEQLEKLRTMSGLNFRWLVE
ncbi:MAG TPA: WGR domain-containing protein, partial [Pyrinomonadaceae bacterium]